MSTELPSASSRAPFDALAIAREFTSHEDPQRRRSAATALRRIGSIEAASSLAGMAVAELKTEVRQHVVEQLEQLLRQLRLQRGEEAIAGPWSEVVWAARSQAKEPRSRAVEVLVQLHEAGVWVEDGATVRALSEIAASRDPSADASSPVVRAEQLLADLDGDSLVIAARHLADLRDQPGRRAQVALLLGRLARQGSFIPVLATRLRHREGLSKPDEPAAQLRSEMPSPGTSRLRWLWRGLMAPLAEFRDVWTLAKAKAPPLLPAPYLRGDIALPVFVLAVIGGLLSAVVVASEPAVLGAIYPSLILAAVVVSLLLAFGATARSVSLSLSHHAPAAAASSLVRSAAFVALVAIPAAPILSVVWRVKAEAVVATFLASVLVVLAIRLGSITAFYAMPSGLTVRKQMHWWPTQLLQLLAGAGAGLALLYAFQRWGHQSAVGSPSRQAVSETLDTLWVFVAPACGGVAAAYSIMDRPAELPGPRPRSRRSWAGPAIAAVAAVLAVAALGAVVMPLRKLVNTMEFHERFEAAKPGSSLTLSAPIVEGRGTSLAFRVDFPQHVKVRPPSGTMRTGDRLSLFYRPSGADDSHRPDCASAGVEKQVISSLRQGDLELLWGCYRMALQSAEAERFSLRYLFAEVRAAVDARRRGDATGRRRTADGEGLEVTLNADEEVARLQMVVDNSKRPIVLPPGKSNWLLPKGVFHFAISEVEAGNLVPVAFTTGLSEGVPCQIRRVGQPPRAEPVSCRSEPGSSLLPGFPPRLSSSLELEPGAYELTIGGPQEGSSQGGGRRAFAVRLVRHPPLAYETLTGAAGTWHIDHLPYIVVLPRTVPPRPRQLSAVVAIPADAARFDLTLELAVVRNGRRQTIERADDPERIDITLGARDYRLTVSDLSDEVRKLRSDTPSPTLQVTMTDLPVRKP